MQERHKNSALYFNEQVTTTQKYVIPFINSVKSITKATSVLEIGCGEGGNLKPFVDLGCERVVGIDLSQLKISNAIKFFEQQPNKNHIQFILSDIYLIEDIGQFDVIIMRDVIEHIHGHERFMQFVKKFLKPDGLFFLGFPPWYNPFGGHQQICKSRILSKLPFFHILPKFLYKFILKIFGESQTTVAELLEIKETRITIGMFERMAKRYGYKIAKKTLYFINPNYETKFGLKPRKQLRIFSAIPVLRSFVVTAGYYVLSLESNKN